MEQDPVVAEMVRLFAGASHGTFTAVARLAGLKSAEAVRKWAAGINRPRKQHWPAIEDYFKLDSGHIARIANEAPPIVVERTISSPDVDALRRLESRLDATDERVDANAQAFRKQLAKMVRQVEALADRLDELDAGES